ncbi:hypothetical protein ACQ4XT_14330 [Halobacillus faecis]
MKHVEVFVIGGDADSLSAPLVLGRSERKSLVWKAFSGLLKDARDASNMTHPRLMRVWKRGEAS